MKLSNKIVLVTGGTSGIGLEAAKLFREEGASVIIVGQHPVRLQSAASQFGDSVTLLRGDVSKPADIESIVEQISRKFGHIDVLFANAGMGLAAPLEAVTEDQIDTQFDVNFKGVFFTIQKAAPLLAKGGSIVVTTSFLNEVGAPGLSILSATKAAARSLVRSLGAELAPRGIRVNAVSPGPVSTPFHGKLGLSGRQLNEAASAIEDQVPLHRFGEAAEIAKAALFLASDDSSFMTGAAPHRRAYCRRGRGVGGDRQSDPAAVGPQQALSLGAGRADPAVSARGGGRADPHRHQKARQVQPDRPSYHRRSKRPEQPSFPRQGAGLGVCACLHRRRFPDRLKPGHEERAKGMCRRLPQGGRCLLCEPWGNRRACHDGQRLLLQILCFPRRPASALVSSTSGPSPIRPRPTARPSASSRPACANGPMPRLTTPQQNAPPNCQDGFTATIGTALMLVSTQSHPSAEFVLAGNNLLRLHT